jgi:hypothetical protein
MHQISGPVAEDIQRTLWAEFTAKYLHLLVDRLLDLPPPGARAQQDGALDYPIQNIYHTTFKFTDIGYLAKFMLSSHTATKGAPNFLVSNISVPDTIQGGKLFTVMAERLVEFAPNWRNSVHYEGAIHRAVTTLFMLVFAAKGHSIPEKTKDQLVNWLQIWAAYKSWSPGSMTPDNDLPRTCHSLSGVLSRPVAMKSIIKQRRRALKCIEVCGLPTCDAETKLKVCSR